jgi:predicted nucleotidyltransferase
VLLKMIKQIPITHNISELIPQASAYLAARKDVLFAYLFGSLALEKFKPLSDIDMPYI